MSTPSTNSATSSSTAPALFSFSTGATTAPSSAPSSGGFSFNFGSFPSSTSLFGQSTSSSTTTSAAAVTFGASNFGNFSSAANAGLDRIDSADGDSGVGADVPYEPTTTFEPIVHLKPVNAITGEENDNLIFIRRSGLMRYDANTKEWKERGQGDMKLLQNRDTAMVRAVMHQERTKKCVCNHFLHSKATLAAHPSSDKAWLWRVADYAEGEKVMTSFALMFKTLENANEFKKMYDDCKEINRKVVKKEVQSVKDLLKPVTATEEGKTAASPTKENAASSNGAASSTTAASTTTVTPKNQKPLLHPSQPPIVRQRSSAAFFFWIRLSACASFIFVRRIYPIPYPF